LPFQAVSRGMTSHLEQWHQLCASVSPGDPVV
jgi:hypothetical protein